ncbi:hypothetical protein PC128_g20054 [Phytophthora cactorum]|nr:hypothetical protein PC120_g24331 [Phytophthora cactorum]KAG3050818.1 hypothetical protein PC121_g18184 [Phytophthora cactorum]KAG3164852.1 hypothetical protein PC128_g20054 [Phytophthora cactorum]KAG4045038.1 hypothetical protein PC123_g19539 [Phytophthora cactorum]
MMEESIKYMTPETRPGPPQSVRDARRERKAALSAEYRVSSASVPLLPLDSPLSDQDEKNDGEQSPSPPVSPKTSGPDFSKGFLPWWRYNALPWQVATYDLNVLDLFYQSLYFTPDRPNKPTSQTLLKLWTDFLSRIAANRTEVEQEITLMRIEFDAEDEGRMMYIHRFCTERLIPCAAVLIVLGKEKATNAKASVDKCPMCYDGSETLTNVEDLSLYEALTGFY